MQDSIEDYIRISNNTKEPKVEDERKRINELTAQRKKECEEHSLKVVEFLIDGQLRPETFVRCLRHINQELYQDIVEERAITEICGYPLCGIKLPKMPNKQYHISIKENKVYDITDRKNYCCNFCYKASIDIKKQIETSPLWLRKPDDAPNFNLLPYSKSEGLPGEEVDHGLAKMENETNFTSISTFSEFSLNEIDTLEIDSREKQRERQNMINSMKYKNRIRNVDKYGSIYEEDEDLFHDENNDDEEFEADLYDNEYDNEIDNLTESVHKSKLHDEINVGSSNLLRDTSRKKSYEKCNKHEEILEHKEKIHNIQLTDGDKSIKPSINSIKGNLSNKNLDDKLKAAIAKHKTTSKQQRSILYIDPLPSKSK